MFKFSKNFFIVFILVTVIPMTFMFFWHHNQIRNFVQKREENFLDIGYKQLDSLSKEYLRTKEDFIQRTVENLPKDEITINKYKNIFDADQIYLITSDFKLKGDIPAPKILNKVNFKNINKSAEYYDLLADKTGKNQEIVSVIIVPFKNSKYKGIVLVDGVHLGKLYPNGPFDLEAYSGEEIESESFLGIIENPYLLNKDENKFKKEPCIDIDEDKEKDKDKDIEEYKVLKLKNINGNTVISLLLELNNNSSNSKTNFIREEHELGLVTLITGFLLSLLVGFYIKKNFINPFIIISEASKKIKNGDLFFKVSSDVKHPEVVETIKVFNDMVDGLKEKNELKNNFITNLTHDLRTPLMAQERAIELIVHEFEELGLIEQLQLTKGVDKNNKHLLRMVNLILESYQFDSNTINLKIADVDIYGLINQCFEQLNILALGKNISLINNISQDFSIIKADAGSLKRIFLNLIVNAIDNIPENSIIQISGKIYNDTIEIVVEDNGTGISSEDISHIFDRYYTGKSDERKIGSGLGLYVCKGLVELHKGKITAESEKDKYTRFIISLPI